MQVRCMVVSIRAADAEMQLVCVGLGLRALIFSLREQIQLSVMNREKACVRANNASMFGGEIEREYL